MQNRDTKSSLAPDHGQAREASTAKQQLTNLFSDAIEKVKSNHRVHKRTQFEWFFNASKQVSTLTSCFMYEDPYSTGWLAPTTYGSEWDVLLCAIPCGAEARLIMQ